MYFVFLFALYVFSLEVLQLEARASYMVGKCFTKELQPSLAGIVINASETLSDSNPRRPIVSFPPLFR